MQNNCIGIFDSGLGGLTVLERIRKHLPNINIIYFGDIKNMPYGDKSQAELRELTIEAFNFLKLKGATDIVTACNSVSTLMVDNFLKISNSKGEIIEMSKPTAQSLVGKYKKVLVLATVATVESHMYRDALQDIEIYTDEVALPGLVDLIEQGADLQRMEENIVDNLNRIDMDIYDAVLLGCTHFSLIKDLFKSVIGSGVEYIDPADSVAEVVANKFVDNVSGGDIDGEISFYISKESKVFNQKVEETFGNRYKVTVV